MRRCAVAALAVMLVAAGVSAQQPDGDDLVRQGIAAYDAGDVDGAIGLYQRALKLEPGNRLAAYELALAYAATRRPALCLELVEPLIGDKTSRLGPLAANLAATCAEATGDLERALKIYKKAIKRFPTDAILRFNEGVSLARARRFADATKSAEKAAALQPAYPSAYLLLSELYSIEERRVPAVLATLRFLSMEPGSKRSPAAAQRLVDLIGAGVTSEDGGKNVTISLDLEGKRAEYPGIDLMLGLLGASRYLEENQDKTEHEVRVEMVRSLLAYLGEIEEEKAKGLVGEALLPFFAALSKDGLSPVFARIALSSLEGEQDGGWRPEYAEDLRRYGAWIEARGGTGQRMLPLE